MRFRQGGENVRAGAAAHHRARTRLASGGVRDGRLVVYTAIQTTSDWKRCDSTRKQGASRLSARRRTGNQVSYLMRFSPDGRSVASRARAARAGISGASISARTGATNLGSKVRGDVPAVVTGWQYDRIYPATREIYECQDPVADGPDGANRGRFSRETISRHGCLMVRASSTS